MQGRLLGLLVVAGVVVSGCLAQPAPQQAPGLAPASAEAAPAPAFRLEAQGCVEGGGHSAHPKWDDYLPEPWRPADVQDDVGPVVLTSEWFLHPGQAVSQETMGNYHATVACDAWSLDGRPLDGHVFGFVGMKVEPPPFDAGPPADRHYLVTVLATSDHGLQETLHGLGFHASMTAGVAALDATGLFHNVLDTEDHGVYESRFPTAEMGPMVPRMRLWWQLENDDGTFSPISLDLANEGGTHLRGQANAGWFSHLRTEDHAPLPGAAGDIYGLAYQGFDRVVEPGPARLDVRLQEAYIHA